jgi:PAS domain S-box-containing protein
MAFSDSLEKKRSHMVWMALIQGLAVAAGAATGYFSVEGGAGLALSLVALVAVPLLSFFMYRLIIAPSYRRLEDANLELHLKQEELLDIKDDLFIKFLGIYDVNYAANSPRMFENRLNDVADVTARVMEADACLIFLYDRKRDDLVLSATNGRHADAVGSLRVALGEGVEGWVGRRLEPVMLRDMRGDVRYREIPGLTFAGYSSVYCLPLYVYSSGALMGVMELLYGKAKNFSDEEITFFTTLAGILSTTVQNDQLQSELRKMNVELEQWVSEKTEELRASEQRYRALVENACEAIFMLAENGDIVFANEQSARLTGFGAFDLIHKNLFELFVEPDQPRGIIAEVTRGLQALRQGELRRSDGSVVPVEITAVTLTLMGKRFIQVVLRDVSARIRLERLLDEKDGEIASLRSRLPA